MTNISETMTAMVTMGHGDYDQLQLRTDWPTPQPKADEVLIRVNACGMNNTDVNTRVGWYDNQVQAATNEIAEGHSEDSTGGWGGAVQFPRIQGADACGKIVAVGEDVSAVLIGKRVITDNWLRNWDEPLDINQAGYFGSERDGGFAQYVTLPEKNVGVVDCDWSDIELATISCSYTTAENMLLRAGIQEGESVLVTGASGGVGSALVQLAKIRSATVIAVSTAEKADALLEIGADAVIKRGQDHWQDVIRATTGKDNVTLVADIVGAPVFENVLSVMDKGARYVTAGAIGGKTVEVNIADLYLKDWALIGSTVNTLDVFPNIIRYIEQGKLKPLVAQTYPLEKIVEAQEAFLAKKHVGNIVLEIP